MFSTLSKSNCKFSRTLILLSAYAFKLTPSKTLAEKFFHLKKIPFPINNPCSVSLCDLEKRSWSCGWDSLYAKNCCKMDESSTPPPPPAPCHHISPIREMQLQRSPVTLTFNPSDPKSLGHLLWS